VLYTSEGSAYYGAEVIEMKFHENLQHLRKEAGLSQEEVAGKLFVSRQSVSKWENGAAEPGIESLKALADLYGVTVDELVCARPAQQETLNEAEQWDRKWAYIGLCAARLVMAFAILMICVEYGYDVEEQWYSFADLFILAVGSWLKHPAVWIILMCMQMFAAIFGMFDLVTMGSFPALVSIVCNGLCVILLYAREIRARFHAERY